LSGHQATIDALHKVQEQVKAAKTIVVGGAGATGVETSGELGYEYGKDKEITLVHSISILNLIYTNSQADHRSRQCPRNPSISRLSIRREGAKEAECQGRKGHQDY
jgi:hypothetical protein